MFITIKMELQTKSLWDAILSGKNKKISARQISSSLKWCHNNCAFSTYSYCSPKKIDSKKIVRKTMTGNCIGLSYALKDYIMKKYNVKSFLIPATVPEHIDREEYLDISHVALMIPSSRKWIFYIADPAFYFVNPIKVDLRKWKIPGNFKMDNIYQDSVDNYFSRPSILRSEVSFNKYQTISKNTPIVNCTNNKGWEYVSFGTEYTSPTEKWTYFITEITNPDKAISSFFMQYWKNKPFITRTRVKNGKTICEVSIRQSENKDVTIKVFPNKIIYEGKPEKIPAPSIKFLVKKLNLQTLSTPKKFSNYIIRGKNCRSS